MLEGAFVEIESVDINIKHMWAPLRADREYMYGAKGLWGHVEAIFNVIGLD